MHLDMKALNLLLLALISCLTPLKCCMNWIELSNITEGPYNDIKCQPQVSFHVKKATYICADDHGLFSTNRTLVTADGESPTTIADWSCHHVSGLCSLDSYCPTGETTVKVKCTAQRFASFDCEFQHNSKNCIQLHWGHWSATTTCSESNIATFERWCFDCDKIGVSDKFCKGSSRKKKSCQASFGVLPTSVTTTVTTGKEFTKPETTPSAILDNNSSSNIGLGVGITVTVICVIALLFLLVVRKLREQSKITTRRMAVSYTTSQEPAKAIETLSGAIYNDIAKNESSGKICKNFENTLSPSVDHNIAINKPKSTGDVYTTVNKPNSSDVYTTVNKPNSRGDVYTTINTPNSSGDVYTTVKKPRFTGDT